MSAFILQRELTEGRRSLWFDADRFDDRERALAALERERAFAQARISMDGGTSYTMRHAQHMRVVEVLA